MELLRVWIDDQLLFTVNQVDQDAIEVELPFKVCKDRAEAVLSQLTYGVEVYADENRFWVVRSKQSGLTEKGKQILLSLGVNPSLLEHNQIWLLPLAILFGLILICSIPFVREAIPICAELGEIWEEIKPYVIYGTIAAIIVGVAALAYRAIAK